MSKGLKELLRRAVGEGRAVHAYLLAGPDAVASRDLALFLAQSLVCESRPNGPCGHCLACRKAGEGNHPDVYWVRPDGASLKLQQMHHLQGQAWLRPTEAPGKVFVLEQAEALTVEAANSLLRILEEPPGGATFILLTGQPQQMLPTILSRCQRLDLTGEAIQAGPELRQQTKDLIARLAGMDELQILDLAEAWDGGRGLLAERVTALATGYRDLLVTGQTGDPGLLQWADEPTWMLDEAQRHRLDSLAAAAEACEQCLRHLERNANPRLAVEVLLFRLRNA